MGKSLICFHRVLLVYALSKPADITAPVLISMLHCMFQKIGKNRLFGADALRNIRRCLECFSILPFLWGVLLFDT
jgi:hypothetical protein